MSTKETFNWCSRKRSVTGQMSDLSPVTNLSLNLKNLSTFEDTPLRPVIWSKLSEHEGSFQSYVDDIQYSDGSLNISEIPPVEGSSSRSILHMPSCHFVGPISQQNKENFSVYSNSNESACKLSKHLFDSGYSDLTPTHFKSSAQFEAVDEGDSFEYLSEVGGEDEDCVKMPDLTSLLTKPLIGTFKQKLKRPPKKGKSSIRRCLSMEMENADSSPYLSGCASNLKSSLAINCHFKRPDLLDFSSSAQCKRRKSSPLLQSSVNLSALKPVSIKRSYSDTSASIMLAVQQAHLDPGLIGDCSKCFALPVVRGRHQDLKCISPQTLVQVIQGLYSQEIDSFTVVDCRYPYEFEGGHIKGAINIYSKERIQEVFLSVQPPSGRNIVIFHCEFSSERAPNLCRYLRNRDRELNEKNYPKLFHPEMYLLEGGYKVFFENFQSYCEPQGYLPMKHKDHGCELRLFRAKSWGASSKPRSRLKSGVE